MVERIMALPNRLEMVRMLNVLPEEGLKLVLAYFGSPWMGRCGMANDQRSAAAL
jgi:hypothetical protein